MFTKILLYLCLIYLTIIRARALPFQSTNQIDEDSKLHLWLTISAEKQFLEVSWINAPAENGDVILLTKGEPHSFEKTKRYRFTFLAKYGPEESSGLIPIEGYTTTEENFEAGSGSDIDIMSGDSADSGSGDSIEKFENNDHWISNNGTNEIVVSLEPKANALWVDTGVAFDYNLSQQVNVNTTCYGYWVSYVNAKGVILATNCIRAYPRWMNELSPVIGNLRLRDLFIPGTHDAGSVKPNFKPLLGETILTKYALTQDDDIRGQLLHGARYLDLRVAYYKGLKTKFYINHGITRHRPLDEVIEHIRDFVQETNEIVIVGFKEFPVGFGKDLTVHRKLVEYLKEKFGNLIVKPSVTWSATLRDIWSLKQNVILAYDERNVVREYPNILFDAVQQRWGNKQTWPNLEEYLRNVNQNDISRSSSRPVADMAELTPETLDVILDTYGGLRRMADNVNWRVSKLYYTELGKRANIVAVDFIRGTSLMEIALEINKRKLSR